MELKYKPILDDFDEDIAVPIGDWTKETHVQLSALRFEIPQVSEHQRNTISSFVEGCFFEGRGDFDDSFGEEFCESSEDEEFISVDSTSDCVDENHSERTGLFRSFFDFFGILGAAVTGQKKLFYRRAFFDNELIEDGLCTSYSGSHLITKSAFPKSLHSELELVARFDRIIEKGESRAPVLRNLVSYVEGMVRILIFDKIPKSIFTSVCSYTKSSKQIDMISRKSNRASLGVIAEWCRLVEKAIMDEHEEVAQYFRTRIGTLQSLNSGAFSNMLNIVAPIRNDLMHGRDIQKDVHRVVPLIFGVDSFHDWWTKRNPYSTPFTITLAGHVAIQMSRKK